MKMAMVNTIVSIPFKRESVSKVSEKSPHSSRPGVSIPFKRESVSKVLSLPTPFHTSKCTGFNSLQTGKCIQSIFTMKDNVGAFVSIPFKRESVSKVKSIVHPFPPTSFQFPSNGKVYPKNRSYTFAVWLRGKFQFPSNGKVYPKKLLPNARVVYASASFNSLQTGKCIQRRYVFYP